MAENNIIAYLTWFLESGIQDQLSWWFWLRISFEAALTMSAGVASPEGLTRAGRSTSKKVHLCGARCWREDPVPQRKDLSTGCLSILVVLQLASPRASEPRKQNGSHSVFYNLALEVTLCPFCSIVVSPIQWERKCHTRGRESLRTILEASYLKFLVKWIVKHITILRILKLEINK